MLNLNLNLVGSLDWKFQHLARLSLATCIHLCLIGLAIYLTTDNHVILLIDSAINFSNPLNMIR